MAKLEHTPGPWEANHITFAEAAELMRQAGHVEAADLADAAEIEWFDGTGGETQRERRAEKLFRAAIAKAEGR